MDIKKIIKAKWNGQYQPIQWYDEKGTLMRYSPKEAWDHTQSTGNFIIFKSPEQAAFFSKHYKDIWR